MPDIPDIKVKVAIEYDGSGIEEAKKDLASLAEMADSFGEGAGSAGDGLAALDEQASKSAEHMQALTSATEDARQAIGQLVEDGAPGQEMLSSMSDAIEEMQTPLEDTTRLLEAAAPPMAQLAEHAQSMVEQIAPVSDGFVQIGEAMGGMNEHAQGLASSMGDLTPQIESGQRAIWQLVEGGAPGQQMLIGMAESAGGAGESLVQLGERAQSLVEPMEAGRKAIWQLVEGGAPGQQMLIGMGDAVEALGESLSATVPMLPQLADSLHALEESAASTGQSLVEPAKSWREFTDVFSGAAVSAAQNIQVFQGALEDPAPFQMIQDHLNETGQTWEDFNSSIGKNNAAMLGEMRENSDATHQALGTMSASFDDVQSSTEGANKAVRDFFGIGADESVVNGFVVKSGDLEGPMEHLASLKPIGMGEAFGGTMSTIMEGMNQLMMPLMAVQMIGMAVSAVGQGIYDMAGIAEGPAAHSLGTFTGSVDALGQTAQKSAEQFSEGFGRQVMPTLDAMNYQMSQGQGSGGLGGGVGAAASFLFNLAQIGTGINPIGGVEGLINQGASAFGMSEPFQGPPPAQQAQINYQRQLASMPQTVQGQTYQAQLQSATMLADATNPGYLQAQDNLGASQQIAQHLQQSYNISHPINQAQLLQDAQYQQYAQQEGPQLASAQANAPNYLQSIGQDISQGNWGAAGNDLLSGTFLGPIGNFLNGMHGGGSGPRSSAMNGMFPGFDSSIGSIFGGIGQNANNLFGGLGQDWNNLFGGGGGTPETMPSSGCFPAGTRVRMADGSERPIETLQVGDVVLSSDGITQTSANVLARIVPPPKPVYELMFSDGNTLTLTDSHPISTTHGWKSIEPKATKRENQELEVSRLMWGDVIHTANGTVQLTSITPCKGKVQVYNITVDTFHTFYANGVLVHNKMGEQIMQNVADASIPQTNLQGSNLMQSLASNFSGADMSHTFTASVSWAATGLEKDFTAVASWIGQNLSKDFTGIASWIGQNLSKDFQGVASWIGQNLSKDFTGIASWIGQNLSKDFQGVASWIGQNLTKDFQGVASWIGQNLTKDFTGIASWIGQNLEHTFTGIASWIGQGLSQIFTPSAPVPGFAAGVEGFHGGLAVVGENGPELLSLPQGASVYPMSSSGGGVPSLPLQGGGDGMATIYLTHITQLDGRTVAQSVIPYIAPMARTLTGGRR